MNHTKTMLADTLLHFRKRAARRDPVWRELAAREEAAYGRVRRRCAGDRALLQEVGDLSDACFALAEYAGEYQFFLGLQMGLELGALDLLARKRKRPFPMRFPVHDPTDVQSGQRGKTGG